MFSEYSSRQRCATCLHPVLFLVDHLAELLIIKLVITAGVKLSKSFLNLLLGEILADLEELILAHRSAAVFVHVLEHLFERRLLAHKLSEGKSAVIVAVHPLEELFNLGHGSLAS